ncbi:E3 ubiquitin-protein ligase MYCBP2 [Mytilus galloprovincialis]|uniref:E3 ubiquitin-protein ligase MYCBP2 n=1 Tax=Mytilus galloprovincialis TaxID=29158 RepID=A0A8B6DDM5_MYTGA|nr:E3 ubiquitin-protein ligase MYCBP2 [Mytilus galloprovincialis]
MASREDENEVYDVNKPGILDVLLACIGKALTVQTKIKASGPQKGVTSMTLSECQLDSKSAR